MSTGGLCFRRCIRTDAKEAVREHSLKPTSAYSRTHCLNTQWLGIPGSPIQIRHPPKKRHHRRMAADVPRPECAVGPAGSASEIHRPADRLIVKRRSICDITESDAERNSIGQSVIIIVFRKTIYNSLTRKGRARTIGFQRHYKSTAITKAIISAPYTRTSR